MERKKYYVNVGSGEISQIKYDNNDSFTIYATDDEVVMLRAKLDNMAVDANRTFFRSHVPIMPYHNDKSNDDYDAEMVEAYRILHELGDETTKQFINSIGILGDNHM
ncbi:hydrolase [Ornithinibacillus xuwenensis]|uniref:Hydrolase n=1 Tax=Ornithinibacillus xuwenensis TaxID=3144668 RepID=A0ABU9XJ43_9BACI